MADTGETDSYRETRDDARTVRRMSEQAASAIPSSPLSPSAILMPSDVSSRVGFFDRFAGVTAQIASRAPFFAFCLLLVLVWLIQGAATIVAQGSFKAFLNGQYQLEINTTTTIITFLMVALLQNSQTRSDQALQHKLNAIADGMADLMMHLSERHDNDGLRKDIKELRLAVGLEQRESSGRGPGDKSAGHGGHPGRGG
jgi:low affinity Fe/Cu permease